MKANLNKDMMIPAVLKAERPQKGKKPAGKENQKPNRPKKQVAKKELFPALEGGGDVIRLLEKQKGSQSVDVNVQVQKFSTMLFKPELLTKANRENSQKRVVYCFQEDLQEYLLKIDGQFLVKIGKRKKVKLLTSGIDFFRRVYQDKRLKPETMLVATFIWHKLYHEFSGLDSKLERFIAPTLWIACKLEEYYPLRASHLCSYMDTFLFTKYNCKYLSKMPLTIEELMANELEVLSFLNFKVFTPSFLNLLHLFEASIFPSRQLSCSRSAVSLLETCYYTPDLFTHSQASLAAGSLLKLNQDKDEEQVCTSILAFFASEKLEDALTPVRTASFITQAHEQRRKEVFARASSSVHGNLVPEDGCNGKIVDFR